MTDRDREMQKALEADGEKLRQLTGADHGPFCPECLGSGVEVFAVTVYEHGCGFSHTSTDERPCRECGGTGRAEVGYDHQIVDIGRASESIAGMVADWYGNAPLPNARITADVIAQRLTRFIVPAPSAPEECPCRNTGDCDGSCTHPAPPADDIVF